MIIQNLDGTFAQENTRSPNNEPVKQAYYAEVPHHLIEERSNLIDQIIRFAFDTLGVHHIEVRVYDPE